MFPHLISLTSCLQSSYFFFQSLTSASLVMIWKEQNWTVFTEKTHTIHWGENDRFHVGWVRCKCVPPPWWGWEQLVFLPHWCRWNPGLDFLFSASHFPPTCSLICTGPRTAEDRGKLGMSSHIGYCTSTYTKEGIHSKTCLFKML